MKINKFIHSAIFFIYLFINLSPLWVPCWCTVAKTCVFKPWKIDGDPVRPLKKAALQLNVDINLTFVFFNQISTIAVFSMKPSRGQKRGKPPAVRHSACVNNDPSGLLGCRAVHASTPCPPRHHRIHVLFSISFLSF